MLAVRAALDALTVEADGVDGKKIYVYGEGWNFGEVANDARFEQATQLNMAGTGIGTFNDRLRDAVRGGGPFDENPRVQGFGSGLLTDPNGDPVNGDEAGAARAAAARHGPDQGRDGREPRRLLASSTAPARRSTGRTSTTTAARPATPPTRRRTSCTSRRTTTRRCSTRSPSSCRQGTPMEDRVRDPAAVAVHGGPRPGGVVLPRGDRHAPLQVARPEQLRLGRLVQHARLLLRVEQLRGRAPARAGQRGQVAVHGAAARRTRRSRRRQADIEASVERFRDLLAVAGSSPLFSLTTAEQVKQKLSYLDDSEVPGLIVMHLDDTVGEPVDPVARAHRHGVQRHRHRAGVDGGAAGRRRAGPQPGPGRRGRPGRQGRDVRGRDLHGAGPDHRGLRRGDADHRSSSQARGVVNPRSRGTIDVTILSQDGFAPAEDVVVGSLRFGRTGEEDSVTGCETVADVERGRRGGPALHGPGAPDRRAAAGTPSCCSPAPR